MSGTAADGSLPPLLVPLLLQVRHGPIRINKRELELAGAVEVNAVDSDAALIVHELWHLGAERAADQGCRKNENEGAIFHRKKDSLPHLLTERNREVTKNNFGNGVLLTAARGRNVWAEVVLAGIVPAVKGPAPSLKTATRQSRGWYCKKQMLLVSLLDVTDC